MRWWRPSSDHHAGNCRSFSPRVRHRGHRASDKRDNLALQANGRAAPCALIWLGTAERHCNGAWGCRSFCFPISPRSYDIRQPCLAGDRHGCLGTERRRRETAPSRTPCCYAVGNYRLVSCDVVRSHMFDSDLLLPSAPVMIEPFGQHQNCPRCLSANCRYFVRAWKYSGGCAQPLRYIASDASLAAINCAINIPSIGSAGEISAVAWQTALMASLLVSRLD